MSFIRSGSCLKCGECCGYPRKTDGGQNNPWPNDWPESLTTWQNEDIEKSAPVFKITGHKERHGSYLVGNKQLPWIWIKNHGLCKDIGNGTWDQRCPFLSDKLKDGTIPCLLYETQSYNIWSSFCNTVPPDFYLTKFEVEIWEYNCPSCSFEFIPGPI